MINNHNFQHDHGYAWRKKIKFLPYIFQIILKNNLKYTLQKKKDKNKENMLASVLSILRTVILHGYTI